LKQIMPKRFEEEQRAFDQRVRSYKIIIIPNWFPLQRRESDDKTDQGQQ
jgi:hypothetical protein